MRQVTTTINVYRYNELSEAARDRARDEYANIHGYPHAEDAFASLEALAKHFHCRLKDWSIDYFNTSHSYAKFGTPDDVSEDWIAARLAELGSYDPETLRGNGDCELTGYCADEDCIDGFRQAWHTGERDLSALLESAFRSWLKACQADCDDYYSDETFAEHCEANDYEFLEDGSFYG